MLKRTGSTLKRKPIQKGTQTLKKTGKISPKPLTKEQRESRQEGAKKMWKLFEEHWRIKGKGVPWRVCESCGGKIYGENSSICHHHLLPKGVERYKYLKYQIDNLMLLCAHCHTQVENGYPGIHVQERVKEVKQRFNIK